MTELSVGVNIDLACDVEMYLRVIIYHKYKTDKHINIDMFNITKQNLTISAIQSCNSEST